MLFRTILILFFTINFCFGQGWEWVNPVNPGAPAIWSNAKLKTDSEGNLYMLSTTPGTVYFQKVNSQGNLIFTRTFSNGSFDFALTGNKIFIAGTFNHSVSYNSTILISGYGGNDIAIFVLSTSGDLLNYTQAGTGSNESLQSLCADENGNLIAFGSYQSSFSIGNILLPSDSVSGCFLIRLDSTLNVTAGKRICSVYNTITGFYSNIGLLEPRVMHSLPGGKIYLAGNKNGRVTFSNNDSLEYSYYGGLFVGYFLNNLEPDTVTARFFSKSDRFLGNALLNESVFTVLSCCSQYGCGNYLIMDEEDSFSQFYNFYSYSEPIDFNAGVSIDSSEHIYLGGTFSTQYGNPVIDNISLGQYYSGGNFIVRRTINDPAEVIDVLPDQYTEGRISVSPAGEIYLLGRQRTAMTFGSIHIGSTSSDSFFLAKWNPGLPIGEQELKKIAGANLNVFPNPCNDLLNIKSDLNITQLIVIDELGRDHGCSWISEDKSHKIDVSHLANGIYCLQASTELGISTRRFIIAR